MVLYNGETFTTTYCPCCVSGTRTGKHCTIYFIVYRIIFTELFCIQTLHVEFVQFSALSLRRRCRSPWSTKQ